MEAIESFHLNCPFPMMETETITLAHGSGGKQAAQLLQSAIFSLLGNELLDKKDDGAVLSLQGKIAMSTDSFVVSPIFFPGGNIGDLAINGTINDLAMCGANPRFMSLSLILEEGLLMKDLGRILLSIQSACAAAGVQIVTGDTKVVEKGKGDQIFINTTGIGEVHPKSRLGASYIQKGDRILLSGPLARHGMAIMSQRKGLEFESKILSDTRPLHEICLSLLEAFGEDIHFFRDPTRGGVASVLHEIAELSHMGMHIHQQRLPIEEEVAGACEMLGIDPLYVANEGLFLAIVAEEVAENCLRHIHQWSFGAHAAIIGEVVEEHPSRVVISNAFGGSRIVSLLNGEQLPRIC